MSWNSEKQTGKKMDKSMELHLKSIARHVNDHAAHIVAEMKSVEELKWEGQDTSYWHGKIDALRHELREIETVLSDMLPDMQEMEDEL
jgi:hypothetical protein